MENNNMRFYDKLKTSPDWAIKAITGGRLQGMSDINPQFRYQVMTEIFGPIGFGWRFEVVRLWTEPGPVGQVFAFAEVKVWYKEGDIWSEPITGIGGDLMIEQEGRKTPTPYLNTNDECFKMAVTDALGVALKYIGVAADIYSNHPSTKYTRKPDAPPAPQTPGKAPQKPAGATGALRPASQLAPGGSASQRPTDAQQKVKKCVINEQVKFIQDLCKQKDIKKEQLEAWLFRHSKIKNVWDIPANEFEAICRFIQDDPGTILGTAAAGQTDDIPPAGEDAPWEGNH
jgi:hypothetical protein